MKLNIGGYKHNNHFKGEGWTSLDNSPRNVGIKCDLNFENIQLKSNEVDAIYTSHTLEHILPNRQGAIFSEMYRVLKPESLIRIVVPDIDYAISRYINKEPLNIENMPSKIPLLPDKQICWLSGWFFTCPKGSNLLGGHVMVYNKELLEWYLSQAKFKNITLKKYNDLSPIFKDCDLEIHKDIGLYMEAQK